MNKTTAVLKHLMDNGSITSMDAIECYGATRLSAIIFNLRKAGHRIDTVTEGGVDRFGHAMNYARYVYHPDEDSQDTLEIE